MLGFARIIRISGISVTMLALSGTFALTQQRVNQARSGPSQRDEFEVEDVSLPASFKLTPPDRLQAFRCLVFGGVVQRIYTPHAWDMTIDNSSEAAGARTEVKADFDIGAAEFDNSNLGYFQDFMTVAWRKEYHDREITLVLTIDTMDARTKKIKFHNQQLVLTPAQRPFHPF